MSDIEVIRIEGVSKKFVVNKEKSLKERLVHFGRGGLSEEYWALKDVSLSIAAGESIGLAGANGSGKSTLLKVIGGILAADKGQVHVRGRVAALLELGAGFHPDLTGRENIFLNGAILGMSEQEIRDEFDSIVVFSGIGDFIDTQVKFYSSGMYVRLAFAVAVHSNPDILLVDEVLAVGDEPFQQKCMDKIRQFQEQGCSIILVSHSAQQIVDVCDRAVVLEHGNIIACGEVRETMAFLHNHYQQQARALAGLDEDHLRHAASIEFLEITGGLSQDEDLHYFFHPGDDLEVTVELNATKPLSGHAIILNISTDRGRHVVGIDTRACSMPLPAFEGRGSIRFTLPAFAIGGGNFLLSAILLDENGLEIDSLNDATMLAVRSTSGAVGMIEVHPVVSFDA